MNCEINLFIYFKLIYLFIYLFITYILYFIYLLILIHSLTHSFVDTSFYTFVNKQANEYTIFFVRQEN